MRLIDLLTVSILGTGSMELVCQMPGSVQKATIFSM